MISTQIIGNLTRDPESRTTTNGATVCTFTVAAERRFPVNGEKVTDFYRVNAWRGLGETCQKFLSKGKKVFVSGEPQPRLYQNKNGETQLSLDIEADRVEFLSPRGESGYAPSTQAAPAGAPAPAADDDDLPF